jgi:HSP20 family protein
MRTYKIKKTKITMNTNTNRNYDWNNTVNYWTNPTSAWNTTPFSAVSNNTPYSSLLTNPFTTRTWLNSNANTPAVNAYESTESYVLEFAAPGYEKESFEVSYSTSTLTVKATPSRNESTESANYSTREFSYSSFTKEFSLPANAEASELRAKYENGVLTVLVPKTTNSTNYKTVRVS